MSKTLEKLGYKLVKDEFYPRRLKYQRDESIYPADSPKCFYCCKTIFIFTDINHICCQEGSSTNSYEKAVEQSEAHPLFHPIPGDLVKEELEAVLKIMEEDETNEIDNDVN